MIRNDIMKEERATNEMDSISTTLIKLLNLIRLDRSLDSMVLHVEKEILMAKRSYGTKENVDR